MLKTKHPKQVPFKILSYGDSVSTKFGIITLSAFSLALLSVIIQLLNYGAISRLNKQEIPTLVQLSSGETIRAQSVSSIERSNEVIKKFVSDTFIRMFNWDGLVQNFNEKGEVVTKPDIGIAIEEGSRNRVTIKAYEASFAITEKEDFRAAFLQKLAEMTPNSLFSGESQVSLIPRFVSEPRKLRDGRWEIDFIATLVTFSRNNNAGEGIPFNKTITVEAITTPQSPPNETTELAKKIYAARQAGLEITQIVDLDLSNRRNN
ncbi:hypothetical protein PN456_17265 [Nodularia spumigena CS-586/05]|uniref:hypothetical protein n=1 Tax=Nodularia spumigena TaxID=70799 RepID=UPI00232F9D3C|nr:hypothetical protein [Nodularia spumigena]MDB9344576.1 hypothetical protein [Nodularia spumigena CS-588/06]MDB9370674.1 hypothetical protein [Nodularia spumigena CS-586/05]